VYKLTHPSHDIRKTYHAWVEGRLDEQELSQIRDGMTIDGHKTAPTHVKVLETDERATLAEVSIKEGRNRQVRKIFDQLGHRVKSLRRVATGKLRLGPLRKGQWRHLTRDEVMYLKGLHITN